MSNLRRFTTTYGKVNLSNKSGSLGVFKVCDGFRRESAVTSGRVEHSSKSHIQATRHSDIGGGFTRQRVEHEEGTVLVCQATFTKNGRVHAEGAIFLRLRGGADMIQINYLPPRGPESIISESIQAFLGEADILSWEEIRLLGIDVPRQYKQRYGEREEIDELFHVEVIRPGTIGKPTLVAVATSEGTVIKAVGTEAPRRVRFRRH